MNSISDRVSIILANKHRRGESNSEMLPINNSPQKYFSPRLPQQCQFEPLDFGTDRRQNLQNKGNHANVIGLVDRSKANTDRNSPSTLREEPPRFNENYIQNYINAPNNVQGIVPFQAMPISPKKSLLYQREHQLKNLPVKLAAAQLRE